MPKKPLDLFKDKAADMSGDMGGPEEETPPVEEEAAPKKGAEDMDAQAAKDAVTTFQDAIDAGDDLGKSIDDLIASLNDIKGKLGGEEESPLSPPPPGAIF